MSLEIIGPIYGSILLQGAPQPGNRRYGMPPGGAFDQESLHIANLLLANSPGTPCLELAMAGFKVRSQGPTVFSWAGAGAMQGSVRLENGDTFQFPQPASGCRSYLGLPGGVQCPDLISKGSVLEPASLGPPFSSTFHGIPRSLKSGPLRVTQGPQASLLPFDALLTTDHEVSHRLDRVGVRLSPEDRFEHSIELASEPSVFGAVQITPSGEPIVLGPDGPTIGGYPKIAVVIHADLDRIGQLRPGDRVSFEHVTLDEARRIGSENRNRLRDLRNLVNASEFSR